MPKKTNEESQKEQSDRFQKAVQKFVDAGKLNPTEADEAMERVMRNMSSTPTRRKEEGDT